MTWVALKTVKSEKEHFQILFYFLHKGYLFDIIISVLHWRPSSFKGDERSPTLVLSYGELSQGGLVFLYFRVENRSYSAHVVYQNQSPTFFFPILPSPLLSHSVSVPCFIGQKNNINKHTRNYWPGHPWTPLIRKRNDNPSIKLFFCISKSFRLNVSVREKGAGLQAGHLV